jgi:Circadian oscillating protein COP23
MTVSHRLSTLSAALLSAAATLVSLPSHAQQADAKFYCGNYQNAPTTMARTARGSVPVIHWKSSAFGENFPPQVRCETVSRRFQEYYGNGTLNFLTTGVINQQPIICAVQFKGGPCGLLFTLRKGSDPDSTLRHLLNVRDRTTNTVLNESVASTFIDMNEFLNTAPAAKKSTLSEPMPTGKDSSSVPSQNVSGSKSKPIW